MVATARGVLCLEKLEAREVPAAVTQHMFATGAGPGGGPQVNVYNDTAQLVRSFFAYDPNFRGGVTVATGDLNSDGIDDIVTGAGPGGGPAVGVFDGATGNQIASFYAFDPSSTAGVKVAVGHVFGPGTMDILVSGYDPIAGADEVRVFQSNGAATPQFAQVFQLYTPTNAGVYNVAASDYDGDGYSDIVLGSPNVQATGTAVQVYSVHRFQLGLNPTYLSIVVSGAVGAVSVAGGNLDQSGPDELGFAYSTGSASVVVIQSAGTAALNYSITNPISGWTGPLSIGFGYIRTPVLGGSVFIGAGSGGGPVLNVRDAFNPSWVEFNQFVYDPSFRGGIYVS